MRLTGEHEKVNREKMIMYIPLLAAGAVVSMLFYRTPWPAVLVLPFAGRIRNRLRESVNCKGSKLYLKEFKDLLFIVSSSVSAGRSMKDALGESLPVLRDICSRDSLMVRDFERAYERMSVGRENDAKVLAELAKERGMEDLSDFAAVYSICKVTGADLAVALNKSAAIIMEKITVDREIEEIVSRKKREGMIIFIMPAIVILFLNLCSPDYIAPLYETVFGRLIMTGAAAGEIGMMAVIRKIVRVEI